MVAAEKEAEKDPNITIFNQTFITTTTYLQSTSVKHHHHSNIHNHLQSQPSNHHNLHNHLQSNITTIPESKTQTTKLKIKIKNITEAEKERCRKQNTNTSPLSSFTHILYKPPLFSTSNQQNQHKVSVQTHFIKNQNTQPKIKNKKQRR
jgi:hypothetical protein